MFAIWTICACFQRARGRYTGPSQQSGEFLAGLSLQLKDNWQVFPTASRAVDFLGFRFFREKTTLRKNLSLRMRRRVKKIHCYTAKHGGKAGHATRQPVMSYAGWLNGTATNGFYEKYIRPYINFKKLKEAIRHETRDTQQEPPIDISGFS